MGIRDTLDDLQDDFARYMLGQKSRDEVARAGPSWRREPVADALDSLESEDPEAGDETLPRRKPTDRPAVPDDGSDEDQGGDEEPGDEDSAALHQAVKQAIAAQAHEAKEAMAPTPQFHKGKKAQGKQKPRGPAPPILATSKPLTAADARTTFNPLRRDTGRRSSRRSTPGITAKRPSIR